MATESTSVTTNISLAPTVSVELLGKGDARPFEPAALPKPSSAARRANGVPHSVLLRLDPSLLLQQTEEEPLPPPPPPDVSDTSVRTIDASLKDELLGAEHRWSEELTRYASGSEIEDAKRLARVLSPKDWERVFICFAEVLVQAHRDRPKKLRARDLTLPSSWHEEPWYLFDPRTFFTPTGAETSTFNETARGLEYVRRLGFENVAMLPHYESDGLAGTSGLVAHSAARELGGPAAFTRLIEHASRIGLRVVTSAPIAAVSLQHKWFEGALSGDAGHRGLFRRIDGTRLLGVSREDGRLFARYATPSGTVYEEPIHDPEILPHDHRVIASTTAGEITFHRSRYPWEVDLDLGSPGLFRHVLTWIAEELNQGVLGKLLDDVVRWFEPAGGAPRVHAMLGLLKLFVRLVGSREILMPIVALPSEDAATFTGRLTEIRRAPVSSEGDLFAWHRAAVALRETVCLSDKGPIEAAVTELATLDLPVAPLAWLEHHDELELDLATSPEHKCALIELTLAHGGALARSGGALAGRLADVLDHDPQRIALAIFCLYMLPAVPLIYQGTETGTTSDAHHAEAVCARRLQYLAALDTKIARDQVHDPVLIHRGALAGAKATRRLRERYTPIAALGALNALRQKRGALRGRAITILSTGHPGVIAWAKRSLGASESDHVPLILIANLTGHPEHIPLGLSEVRSALALSPERPLDLADVLGPLMGNGAEPPVVHTGQDRVLITVAPYHFLALEAARAPLAARPRRV